MDKIGEILAHFDKGIRNLKLSVRTFEGFDSRFADLDSAETKTQEVSLEKLKQKVFVDEFFDPSAKDIIPKDHKSYDMKNHQYNEKFLAALFTRSESTLPIQNMGEMAFIIQKYKESFSILDIALKLYKVGPNADPTNTLKYKVLSLLGSLLDTQQDHQSVAKINQTIFKSLEHVDCYEKVFALRNYGYLLARNEETRHEGKDYIEQAETLEVRFPYWSERKMNLFVPVMGPVLDETAQL